MEFIKTNIKFLTLLLSIVISVLIGLMVFLVNKNKKTDEVLEAKKKLIATEKKMYGLEKSSFGEWYKLKHGKHYSEMQIYLSKYGVNYMLKRVVDPVEYLLAKIVMTVIFALCGTSLEGFWGLLIGGILGYNVLDFIIKMSNSSDNKSIMQDIRSVYETLKIRTESGIFLTKAIESCFMVVENERLKAALMTLGTELSTTNNVKAAVDSFQLKFKNKFVDQLCLTIRQSYESGSTLNSLTDISNNINNMQKSLETETKSKLEWDSTLTQLLLLVAIIFSILFVIFSSFIENFSM